MKNLFFEKLLYLYNNIRTSLNKISYNFTNREIDILKQIILGKNNREIAKTLSVSIHTVKFYVSSILYKMAVSTRIEAAVKAVRERLI